MVRLMLCSTLLFLILLSGCTQSSTVIEDEETIQTVENQTTTTLEKSSLNVEETRKTILTLGNDIQELMVKLKELDLRIS